MEPPKWLRPGRLLQNIQTGLWLWSIGGSVVISATVGGALRAWTSFGIFWQTLLALGVFLLSLASINTVVGKFRDWRRTGNSNAELGTECLSLAQEMVEALADAQRMTPPYSTTRMHPGATAEETHQMWAEGVTESQRHEANTIARFKEKFSVQMAGLIVELMRRGIADQQEVQALYWNFNTLTWMDKIPQKFAEWGSTLVAKK